MSVQSRTYYPIPGETTLYHPSLYAVRILGVFKDGLAYNKTTGSPTNIQYLYSSNFLYFDPGVPFNDDTSIEVLFNH